MTLEEKYMSRKFLLATVIWLAGTSGWWLDMMDSSQWISFSTWILGLYMTGNVGHSLVVGMTSNSAK